MNLWPFHHRKKTNIASVAQTQQGIQLQSAAAAIAIPIVYGQARVAGNLIHYKDLVGGSVENLLISLTHAVIVMGICEGPVTDIIHVWYGKQSRTVAGAGGLTVFTGTLSQAPWGFLTTNFPTEAVPYELTAYVASSIWPLKEGASLPNFNWEVRGFLQWNYPTILDSNPKDVLTDFLTDPNHGALFPSAQIASLTTFRDYCTSAGIFLSPGYTTQQSAAQHMVELLALANSAFVWSDGLLKVIPYGDTALSGNGATYTPNVTPVYDLTDGDFIVSSGEDPVRVSRKPQADAYNHIQLQFENRAKEYNLDIAEAKDQVSIELTGLRTAPVMNAPQIKDAAVARLVVQLALQRQVYIRNTFEFKLGIRFVLLEPMDLVTLTDANLGLNQTTVRLTKIEEQDDDTFLCTAEEWPFGVATASLYGTPSEVGYAPNIPSSPSPPIVAISFDASGQAILNLTGDKSTVAHIYVLRTDRVPTLAETQAGTVVNTQTASNIATGVSVSAGAAVYVGDLAYNQWGDESALVTGVFRRQGSGTSAPPVPFITPLNTEADDTVWNLQFNANAGSGGGGANLTYTIKAKVGVATYTTLSTGNAVAFPLNLSITRDLRNSKLIKFEVTDTATGLFAAATWTAPSQRPEIDSTGRVQRARTMSDGFYAPKASDSAGSIVDASVTESGGKAINRFLGKALAADPDNADSVIDSLTKRVIPFSVLRGSDGGLLTLVDYGAKVGDTQAGTLAKRHGIFFSEVFDQKPITQGYGFSGTLNNGTLVSTAGVASVGTNVYQVTNYEWQMYPGYIPFNPSKLYRLRVRYRCTVDAGTAGTRFVYIWLQSFDAARVATNNNGGFDYVAVSGDAATVAQGWKEVTTWVKGATVAYGGSMGSSSDPTAPTSLHVNTSQVRPGFGFNYAAGGTTDGTYQIDYIQIEEMDEDAAARAYNAVDSGFIIKAPNIDFARGYTGKHGGNIARDSVDATKINLVYQQLSNSGHAISTMQESGGKAINRLLGKALAADPDDLDGAQDGTTYKKITGVSGGLVQTASIAAAAVGTTQMASASVTPTIGAPRNRCSVWRLNPQSINNATPTILTFDQEFYDSNSLHDVSTSNSRITVPAGGNIGAWLISAQVSWGTSAVGVRTLEILKNSGAMFIVNSPPTGAGGLTHTIFAFDDAPSVGDYYEVRVTQTSGGALNCLPLSHFFSATHIW